VLVKCFCNDTHYINMLASITADQQHLADAELQRLAGANAAALVAAQLDTERAQAALQSQIRSSIIAAAATATTATAGTGSVSDAGTAEQLAEAQAQVQQLLAEAASTQALLCKYRAAVMHTTFHMPPVLAFT
jgi:hypothetical protein